MARVSRLLASVALLISGTFGLSATAQTLTLRLFASPTTSGGFTSVTLTATITPWGLGNSGTITYSDNGLKFQNATVSNASGGIVTTQITNIYPGSHDFSATFTGAHNHQTTGTLSGTYGTVILPVPPAGSTYLGAWATSKDGLSPANIAALESSSTGIDRKVAMHLEYAGWTNNNSLLWTDLIGTLVNNINVTAIGSSYATPPVVTFSGGGGTGAAATAKISSTGTVSGISLTNGGSGYTSAPTVIIPISPSGDTAMATATLSCGSVSGFTITYAGSGYTPPPTVTLSGGGGTGATATAEVNGEHANDGRVLKINITNNGSGYTSAPTVTISGGGGSGAMATATIGGLGAMIGDDLSNGRVPVVSWDASAPNETIENIAAGNDNDYIDHIAQGLATLSGAYSGKPIMIRWFWEMNGSNRVGSYSAACESGRQADYKTAFQYIVNRIRTDFASSIWNPAGNPLNVVFSFNPSGQGGVPTDPVGALYYPGDQWVDWIGLDKYDDNEGNTDFQTVPTINDTNGFYPTYTNSTLPSTPGYDKPLMIGENGARYCEHSCTAPSSSDNQAIYINSVSSEIPTLFPQIKLYNYFSSIGSNGDWELDGTLSTGGGLLSFKNLACSAAFEYPSFSCP